MAYCVIKAVRYPKTPITYYYCSSCKIRFPTSEKACPKCGDRVDQSPENRRESPLPWYGSVILIIIGAAIWGWSAACDIVGISELGRILVYIPLGNLFGLSLKR